MKRTKLVLSLAGALLFTTAIGWWARAQNAATQQPLAAMLPPGALLYLEAKNFGSLLSQWNGSDEKKKWVGSANYDVLSRSRLLGRLEQAQGEVESVAGVSTEMKLLQQVAGKESAFAFYELGDLKFVYVTRMENGRLEANDLWQMRAKYQPRESAGIPFFVKSDLKTGRTVAFASKEGLFIIATDEALMAQTVALVAGRTAPSLANEEWFGDVTRNRKPGDLRLVYNMNTVGATPQFRTYWIQQNQTELKQYVAGISDLFESGSGFEEERGLVRNAAIPAPSGPTFLRTLVSAVPAGSSLYRGWASPSKEELASAVGQVLSGEPSGSGPQHEFAPSATAELATPAYASDLETRIDVSEKTRDQATANDAVIQALQGMQPQALLHVQTTVALRDGVFVVPNSTVAIACANPDLAALRRVLSQTLGGAVTSGGLDPLTIRLEGKIIVLARGEALYGKGVESTASGVVETYAAGYNHAAEYPKYTRLFAILDPPKKKPGDTPDAAQPSFFSGNIQSLGNTLSRLQKATLMRTDSGVAIAESVRYELK